MGEIFFNLSFLGKKTEHILSRDSPKQYKTTNKCSKIQTNEQTNKLTKNQNVENKKLNVNEIEQGTANVQNYKCSKYKWKNVKSEYVNRSSWICKKEKEMSMWIVKRWGDVSIKSS